MECQAEGRLSSRKGDGVEVREPLICWRREPDHDNQGEWELNQVDEPPDERPVVDLGELRSEDKKNDVHVTRIQCAAQNSWCGDCVFATTRNLELRKS